MIRRALKLAAACAVLTASAVGVVGTTTAAAGGGTPTFALYAAPGSLPNADNAGEPSIGVNWNTGAVLYQSYASTYKVAFNDASTPASAAWTNVTAPGSAFNIDPILFTDSSVGRTYAGGLAGACSSLFKTDNDGGSWSAVGNSCAGTIDHETIGAGPWHGVAPLLSSYNRAVYYCAQNGNDACVTSSDGGTSFGAPVLVGGACSSLHGHVKVSADGTAYLPNAHCGGKAGGGITTNNGGAWNSYTILQSGEPAAGFDPSVATTPDNTVYEAWAQPNGHPYVARSTNHGSAWDRVTDLSTTISPAVVTSTFQDVVAGDNGRLAVAYLGSTTSGDPFAATWHGVWDLYVSYSYDGGVTWTTIKATNDPVQRGWMCAGGTGCGSGRNLLDFMDAQTTKDGRVVVGFADGCINACAGTGGTEAQSTDAYATIARQSTGKGLFAAYDTTGPTAPSAPVLSGTASNGQVALSWTTPANNGAPITGYTVRRGTTSGGETTLASLSASASSYTDTAVTNGTTYYYNVTATNSAGTGPASNEVSARPSTNAAPTACFTHAESVLTTSTNGGCSSDSDGSISAYAWTWGDGSPAGSGATASHTYPAGGAYTVTLTVTDNGGATATTSQAVTVTAGGDPDPSTPNLTSGVGQNGTSAPTSGTWKYYKINVPSGRSQLRVVLTGPTCPLLGCNPDLDLYVRKTAKPTTTVFDGSSATGSNSETVTIASPAAAYYYVGVYVYSGSTAGNFTVTATVT